MTKPLSIAIAGVAGRMGRQVAARALDAGDAVVGGTERDGSEALGADIAALAGRGADRTLGIKPKTAVSAAAADANTWIDFTTPAATLAALEALEDTPVRAVIIGTTGFDAAQDAALDGAVYSGRFSVVKAGNFSLGVNLMTAVTRLVAARLDPDWDVEILETHHRRKVDAPSGTALMLGEAAARGRGRSLSDLQAAPYLGTDRPRQAGEIGFAVRRSGGVVGEHDVSFTSETEQVRLAHTALDRSVFADGALAAARWAIVQPPGLYDMEDVLGLKGLGT